MAGDGSGAGDGPGASDGGGGRGPVAPGGRGPADPGERAGRRLTEPPSARYATPAPTPAPGSARSALRGPLARATIVALAGAVLMVVVGVGLASTFGLLFAAGIAGAATGLVLSRAAAPRDETHEAVPRRTVAWLAIGLALAAVGAAATATWLIARQQGGTLDLVDYLFTTFGPFVPAEALVAALTAWWGATAGPVQS